MKTMKEMSVKELREVAKEYGIAGRWDMNKTQLIEAIEKVEAEKAAAKAAKAPKAKKAKKESTKSNAMRIQRAFVEVGAGRKEIYRYITITVKNLDEDAAAEYIDKVCAKMTEMDSEYGCKFQALRCPDYDEEAKTYTDTISFEKAVGKIGAQRQYTGKLMTKAMAEVSKKEVE